MQREKKSKNKNMSSPKFLDKGLGEINSLYKCQCFFLKKKTQMYSLKNIIEYMLKNDTKKHRKLG